MTEPLVTSIGAQLLRYLSLSGLFITVALSYTGGLQGTGDTRSPLYISIVSQIVVPIGLCSLSPGDARPAAGGHLAGDRARPLHARGAERARGSARAWRQIAVDIEPARP